MNDDQIKEMRREAVLIMKLRRDDARVKRFKALYKKYGWGWTLGRHRDDNGFTVYAHLGGFCSVEMDVTESGAFFKATLEAINILEYRNNG